MRFHLRGRICTAVRKSFKHPQWGKAGSAVRDLGCTILELKTYLESMFEPGMNWDNWSYSGWHIDHIIPLGSFDLTDREQFLKAAHFTNLRPMWGIENIRKGAKIA